MLYNTYISAKSIMIHTRNSIRWHQCNFFSFLMNRIDTGCAGFVACWDVSGTFRHHILFFWDGLHIYRWTGENQVQNITIRNCSSFCWWYENYNIQIISQDLLIFLPLVMLYISPQGMCCFAAYCLFTGRLGTVAFTRMADARLLRYSLLFLINYI